MRRRLPGWPPRPSRAHSGHAPPTGERNSCETRRTSPLASLRSPSRRSGPVVRGRFAFPWARIASQRVHDGRRIVVGSHVRTRGSRNRNLRHHRAWPPPPPVVFQRPARSPGRPTHCDERNRQHCQHGKTIDRIHGNILPRASCVRSQYRAIARAALKTPMTGIKNPAEIRDPRTAFRHGGACPASVAESGARFLLSPVTDAGQPFCVEVVE